MLQFCMYDIKPSAIVDHRFIASKLTTAGWCCLLNQCRLTDCMWATGSLKYYEHGHNSSELACSFRAKTSGMTLTVLGHEHNWIGLLLHYGSQISHKMWEIHIFGMCSWYGTICILGQGEGCDLAWASMFLRFSDLSEGDGCLQGSHLHINAYI